MSRPLASVIVAACAASASLWLTASPAAASYQVGKFTINFAMAEVHRNGDFVVPGLVTGTSPDGDFRADRAIGNYQRRDVTLVGHVLLHERVTSPHGPPQPPLTLTADQFHIDSSSKVYVATGSARAVQGTRTLVADMMQLNDATHDSTFTGNVHAVDSDRTLDSQEIHYNTATGALDIPVAVNGRSADGDFRADRASGNERAGTFSLFGNVLVHKLGGGGKAGASQRPLTLQSDRLDIANQTKMYNANGHVRVTQDNRILNGPHLALDDNTHVATMTGGVHGLQTPNSTFDAAELIYNTQTEDFKALGGVRMTFPYRRGGSSASPSPSPKPSPH